MTRLKECEEEPLALLLGPMPGGLEKLVVFHDKKMNLMVELNQIRLLEERLWR